MDSDTLARIEARRSIEEWGAYRDCGDWDRLAALFHPDAEIQVAWYQGHFRKFIELSSASSGKSFSKHTICNSSIDVNDGRATAETNVILVGRSIVTGVLCHGETLMRFFDRLIRSSTGRWQIRHRICVYDHDVLFPMSSDAWPGVPEEDLAKWPIEYRYLAARLTARGLKVSDELPTRGSSSEAEVRRSAALWLAK